MQSDLQGTRVVLAKRPSGKPVASDFRLEAFSPAELHDDEVLVKTRYLSLDPYMRGTMDDKKSYRPPTPIGGVMVGEAIAEVIASRSAFFSAGDMVLARTGWASHAVLSWQNLTRLEASPLPVTTRLGVLGMPGFTAYGGLNNIGRPQPGETVVVAAASGPVGSLVGQLAKIGGARAVGIVGGPEKCAFVKDQLGFDAVVDRRSEDFNSRLAAACPNGIDVYFENVGGVVWQAVLPLLNLHARVPVCGLVSQYNGAKPPTYDLLAETMARLVSQRITMTGFIHSDFSNQRPKFLEEVSTWVAEGRVRFKETFVIGLERAAEAFIGMLEGDNFGKLIVELPSMH